MSEGSAGGISPELALAMQIWRRADMRCFILNNEVSASDEEKAASRAGLIQARDKYIEAMAASCQ